MDAESMARALEDLGIGELAPPLLAKRWVLTILPSTSKIEAEKTYTPVLTTSLTSVSYAVQNATWASYGSIRCGKQRSCGR